MKSYRFHSIKICIFSTMYNCSVYVQWTLHNVPRKWIHYSSSKLELCGDKGTHVLSDHSKCFKLTGDFKRLHRWGGSRRCWPRCRRWLQMPHHFRCSKAIRVAKEIFLGGLNPYLRPKALALSEKPQLTVSLYPCSSKSNAPGESKACASSKSPSRVL